MGYLNFKISILYCLYVKIFYYFLKFDLWNDKQRKWFLMNILSRCRPNQICFLEEAFDQIGVFERKDFTAILPTNLSKHIFSFLSAKDLARCAQVSSHWKYLSEQVNF